MNEGSSSAELADYSVYRSVELGKKIGETLSLLERVRALGRPIVLVMLGMAVVSRFILIADAAWLRVLGIGYGLVVGLVVGVLTGIVWLVHTELRRLEELLLLILDVSARVARARAGEGGGQRPTPAELLPPVYKQVFAPLIAEVLRKQSRLVGRPLSWVVDAVLDRAVKLLAKVLERRKVGWEWFERKSKASEQGALAGGEQVALPPAGAGESKAIEAGRIGAGEGEASGAEPVGEADASSAGATAELTQADRDPGPEANKAESVAVDGGAAAGPGAPAPSAAKESREGSEADEAEAREKPSESAGTRAMVEEVGQRIRAKFVPLWVGLGLLAGFTLAPVVLVALWAG